MHSSVRIYEALIRSKLNDKGKCEDKFSIKLNYFKKLLLWLLEQVKSNLNYMV